MVRKGGTVKAVCYDHFAMKSFGGQLPAENIKQIKSLGPTNFNDWNSLITLSEIIIGGFDCIYIQDHEQNSIIVSLKTDLQ